MKIVNILMKISIICSPKMVEPELGRGFATLKGWSSDSHPGPVSLELSQGRLHSRTSLGQLIVFQDLNDFFLILFIWGRLN